MQGQLAMLGLSSLGRAESHVLATVDAVLAVLHHLVQRPGSTSPRRCPGWISRLASACWTNTRTHCSVRAPGRSVRIMVTMPGEAAADYTLVHPAGTGHGLHAHQLRPRRRRRVVANDRAPEAGRAGRWGSCRVVMDLAGPKLRTGPMEPGPAVVRSARARRYGRVIRPARVWLRRRTHPHRPRRRPTPASPCRGLAGAAARGGTREVTDARGAGRSCRSWT